MTTKRYKYEFIPNIWISFDNGGVYSIGRTFLMEGNEMVAVVTEEGKIGHLEFSIIENPRQIKFNTREENERINQLNKVIKIDNDIKIEFTLN